MKYSEYYQNLKTAAFSVSILVIDKEDTATWSINWYKKKAIKTSVIIYIHPKLSDKDKIYALANQLSYTCTIKKIGNVCTLKKLIPRPKALNVVISEEEANSNAIKILEYALKKNNVKKEYFKVHKKLSQNKVVIAQSHCVQLSKGLSTADPLSSKKALQSK